MIKKYNRDLDVIKTIDEEYKMTIYGREEGPTPLMS